MLKKSIYGILVIAVVAIGWFLLSPIFLNVEVNEELTTSSSKSDMPVVVRKGTFQTADELHSGEGNALLYQNPDKSHFLRFENFTVTNGPDLVVYLVKHPNPSNKDEVTQGFVKLAKLKGNMGNQNYNIPKDIDLSQYNSVAIWCELFGVLFSPAALK
jgi:hypothetical protein